MKQFLLLSFVAGGVVGGGVMLSFGGGDPGFETFLAIDNETSKREIDAFDPPAKSPRLIASKNFYNSAERRSESSLHSDGLDSEGLQSKELDRHLNGDFSPEEIFEDGVEVLPTSIGYYGKDPESLPLASDPLLVARNIGDEFSSPEDLLEESEVEIEEFLGEFSFDPEAINIRRVDGRLPSNIGNPLLDPENY
jgi:hypothetical protein